MYLYLCPQARTFLCCSLPFLYKIYSSTINVPSNSSYSSVKGIAPRFIVSSTSNKTVVSSSTVNFALPRTFLRHLFTLTLTKQWTREINPDFRNFLQSTHLPRIFFTRIFASPSQPKILFLVCSTSPVPHHDSLPYDPFEQSTQLTCGFWELK